MAKIICPLCKAANDTADKCRFCEVSPIPRESECWETGCNWCGEDVVVLDGESECPNCGRSLYDQPETVSKIRWQEWKRNNLKPL